MTGQKTGPGSGLMDAKPFIEAIMANSANQKRLVRDMWAQKESQELDFVKKVGELVISALRTTLEGNPIFAVNVLEKATEFAKERAQDIVSGLGHDLFQLTSLTGQEKKPKNEVTEGLTSFAKGVATLAFTVAMGGATAASVTTGGLSLVLTLAITFKKWEQEQIDKRRQEIKDSMISKIVDIELRNIKRIEDYVANKNGKTNKSNEDFDAKSDQTMLYSGFIASKIKDDKWKFQTVWGHKKQDQPGTTFVSFNKVLQTEVCIEKCHFDKTDNRLQGLSLLPSSKLCRIYLSGAKTYVDKVKDWLSYDEHTTPVPKEIVDGVLTAVLSVLTTAGEDEYTADVEEGNP